MMCDLVWQSTIKYLFMKSWTQTVLFWKSYNLSDFVLISLIIIYSKTYRFIIRLITGYDQPDDSNFACEFEMLLNEQDKYTVRIKSNGEYNDQIEGPASEVRPEGKQYLYNKIDCKRMTD